MASSSNLFGWALFFLSLILILVDANEMNTWPYWLFVIIFGALMVWSTCQGRKEEEAKKQERKDLMEALTTLTKEVHDGFAEQARWRNKENTQASNGQEKNN